MLTQDEAELYDRQIRLWGVNAQSKLRQSKVLMLGFNGAASEVAKILVLAGIDTLTIVDDQPLQDNDLSSNLFCRPSATEENLEPYRTHAVVAKLKTLNPLVKVNIDNSPLQSKSAADFKGYDLVTLHIILGNQEISSINNICRAEKIKFYLVFDYGFFGFIFNDLGKEFQFTYEDFTDAPSQQETNMGVGDERDPISLGDDEMADGSSDDEQKDRPAKRRRYHSPGRVSVTKAETVHDKKTKIGKLYYTPFEVMLDTLKNSSYTKQTNPVLFISIAILQFYSQFKHLPRHGDLALKQEDLTNLNNIITSMREALNLDDVIFKNLNADWYENIYGSLSPVCAIVGGVAGQDMIRSLSYKDIPLNNTFSFDGMAMNGGVHRVGGEVSIRQVKPIVRDFVEIDSD